VAAGRQAKSYQPAVASVRRSGSKLRPGEVNMPLVLISCKRVRVFATIFAVSLQNQAQDSAVL